MKLHEFQAKTLLARAGVPVPRGEATDSAAAVAETIRGLGGRAVVKAQIHAGGRGKGTLSDAKTGKPVILSGESKPLGGVRVVASPEAGRAYAEALLGSVLTTIQTGAGGRVVRRILVEEALDIDRELYAGILVDRGLRRIVVMASAEGGMEIETVAAERPEAILKEFVDPAIGLRPYAARRLAFGLGLTGEPASKLATLLLGLYKAFEQTDASLVEINPLVITKDGRVLALDAKMTLDDNALHRHADLKELRDLGEEDPLEVEASKFGLNYIKLQGTVGCMVNGAGLAMATMDIIKLAGGEPANFLDVGGGASKEQVANAFRILLSDPSVKAVLINIFGGIMRCDIVAEGVVAAAREVGVSVPIVVRLEGTNVEQGREILSKSGLAVIVARGMGDAAERVVAAASGKAA